MHTMVQSCFAANNCLLPSSTMAAQFPELFKSDLNLLPYQTKKAAITLRKHKTNSVTDKS